MNNSTASHNVGAGNDPHSDDEMASWLHLPQYPLDASLERNYCSDFFGELPGASIASLQDLRDSFTMGHQQQQLLHQQHQQLNASNGRIMRNPLLASAGGSGGSDLLSRAASVDAALAQGAGRAAGVLPTQAGVEAFAKVRTYMQQPYTPVGKWSPNSNNSSPPAVLAGAGGKAYGSSAGGPGLTPGGSSDLRTIAGAGSGMAVSSLSSCFQPQPPTGQGQGQHQHQQQHQLQQQHTSPNKMSAMNFSHFSRPAVQMKANLQGLNNVSPIVTGGGVSRPKLSPGVPNAPNVSTPHPPLGSTGGTGSRPFDPTSTSSGSSLAESSTTRQQPSDATGEDTNVLVQVQQAQQVHQVPQAQQDPQVQLQVQAQQQLRGLAPKSMWPAAVQNPLLPEVADNSAVDTKVRDDDPTADPATAHAGPGLGGEQQEKPLNSGVTGCETGVLDTPTAVSQGVEVQDRPEPTITSSSGASGSSLDRVRAGVTSNKGKRRAKDDESECQSDDADEDVPVVDDLKKPQTRGPTIKRTRAAEVHNLSERRRRDRINEKMKALQELIPNSNKADKASMLDEAIEYLKMLQVQLQMMSMRSGMGIPSMIPPGMQHVQMGGMPPLGMGMGPMVGMGMGMLDMNSMAAAAAAGRAPSHLVPHPHPSHHHAGASMSGSPLLPHHPHHQPHGGPSYNVPQMIPLPSHGPSYSVSPMMAHHPTRGGAPSHSISATTPAVTMVDSYDVRLQGNSALESVYLARQPLPVNQSMEVYNAYMLHNQQHQQQQQHQQHQQYQLQQQQQQHHQQSQQLHCVPKNDMTGGGPE